MPQSHTSLGTALDIRIRIPIIALYGIGVCFLLFFGLFRLCFPLLGGDLLVPKFVLEQVGYGFADGHLLHVHSETKLLSRQPAPVERIPTQFLMLWYESANEDGFSF